MLFQLFESKMKGRAFFFYGISFAMGVVLLWWGYENLFPIENMENRLVEEYLCNWFTAPIVARIVIALSFITGLFLLLRINPRNILPKMLLGMMALALFDLTWEIFTTTDIITSGYARFFGAALYLSILICITLVFGALVIIKFGKPADLKQKWIKYPLGIILFFLPFVLNPVYPVDLMDQSAPMESPLDLQALTVLPKEYLTTGQTLLTLYTTGCPHCLNAVRRLAISRKQSQGYIPVFIGFLGSEEGISAFFKEARAKFDYAILESDQFFELSGSTYPSFILLENGEATSRWDGRTFNYYALQELAE